MTIVEMTADVGVDRKIVVQLPPEVELGQHHIVITVDNRRPIEKAIELLRFPAYDVGLACESMTFRREDIYGDDGR